MEDKSRSKMRESEKVLMILSFMFAVIFLILQKEMYSPLSNIIFPDAGTGFGMMFMVLITIPVILFNFMLYIIIIKRQKLKAVRGKYYFFSILIITVGINILLTVQILYEIYRIILELYNSIN